MACAVVCAVWNQPVNVVICRQLGQLSELAVVCVRLKAGKTAARRYAERHGLQVLDWPPPPDLAAGRYQLGVVASFGHLLPRKLIDLFPA